MKKFIIIFVALLFILTSCDKGKISNVNLDYGTSEKFTQEEIEDAMNVVLTRFSIGFEGCTMTELYYDEEEAAGEEESLKALYHVDEAIVLHSSFDVDESSGDGSLSPNETYSGFKWFLIRRGNSWILKSWGY